jgi:hypothetical protein
LKISLNIGGVFRTILDITGSKTPKQNIEQQASKACHRFEYLTLLNTCPDATTRDQQGIDEYNLWEVVDPLSPNER